MRISPILLLMLAIIPPTCADEFEAASPPEKPLETAPGFKPKSQLAALGLVAVTTAIPVYAGLRMSNFPDHVICCGEPDARDIAGYTLATVALVLGPASGQYYAGEHRAAKVGLIIRTVGFSLIALGLANTSIDPSGGGESGIGAMAFGGALILGSAAYSILTTPGAVDRYNDRARKAAGIQASFAPALFPIRDGRNSTQWVPGLALSASF